MSEVAKAHDDSDGLAEEQNRQIRMPEARIGLLEDEFDSIKRKDSTGGNTEAVSHMVADVKDDMKGFVDRLLWQTFHLYASIRGNVDQPLVEVSKLLKKMFNHLNMALHYGVHDAIRGASEDVQKSIIDTPTVVDRSLSLIVGHSKCDETVWPGLSFAYFANNDSRRNHTRAAFDSRGVPMSNTPWSLASASPGATEL